MRAVAIGTVAALHLFLPASTGLVAVRGLAPLPPVCRRCLAPRLCAESAPADDAGESG